MDYSSLEFEMEMKALRDSIDKLKLENKDLLKVLEENDLLDEVGLEKNISAEERICIDGITCLAKVFESGNFEANDVKNIDILHKNLRMIKGLSTDMKKTKTKFNPADALKIVEGFKDN